ncbi:hypothetical protein AXG93_4201s1040 [Marchantia polymorpha subsp. ruderalis]|uniref:Uncharacterized protein n=1 Tax=Marchantia polymorpha subsp. ruderalis TaxID=1480154 RepID=A0A176WDG8_MARPO|nr:hypothetical protein AXG93_4201s1040 [Marchantia polymorpha subsp. ruderalis]
MPLTWTDKFKCPGMGVGSLCSSEAKRNTSPPLAPLSAPKKKISMWQRTLVSSLQHGNLVQCFFTYCPARLSFPFLPIPIPSLGGRSVEIGVKVRVVGCDSGPSVAEELSHVLLENLSSPSQWAHYGSVHCPLLDTRAVGIFCTSLKTCPSWSLVGLKL